MCCLFTTLVMLGPRAGILIWWLLDPRLWGLAFDTFIWPFLGFLFLPWTTLMWVLVYPGGITGFDYIWIGIGVLFDLFSWFGGGYTNRNRMPGYTA